MRRLSREDKQKVLDWLDRQIEQFSGEKPVIVELGLEIPVEQLKWEIENETEIGRRHAKIILRYLEYKEGRK